MPPPRPPGPSGLAGRRADHPETTGLTECRHWKILIVASHCIAARFLLKPGRAYADAVKRFSPYNELREPYAEGVAAGARLAALAGKTSNRKRPAFLYVNNRFEGNAPQTIRRMLDAMDECSSGTP